MFGDRGWICGGFVLFATVLRLRGESLPFVSTHCEGFSGCASHFLLLRCKSSRLAEKRPLDLFIAPSDFNYQESSIHVMILL